MGDGQKLDLDLSCEICLEKFSFDSDKDVDDVADLGFVSGMQVHPACFLKDAQEVKIEELGTKHLETPLMLTGVIVFKSPKKFCTTSAKYECPSCGNNHTIRQSDEFLLEPRRCSCGRKGNFRLIRKVIDEIVDLTIQTDGHTIDVKPLKNEQAKDIDAGDKVQVVGALQFENKEARGKTLNEVRPIIRPVKVILVEKGKSMNADAYLKKINGYDFEQLTGRILTSKGYQAVVTKKTGDGGADVHAVIDGKRAVVQCKHHIDKTIGTPDMDKLLGVMAKNKVERGLFICTGKFSQPAIDLAVKNNVELWDKERVLREMVMLKDFTQEANFANIPKEELKVRLEELRARFIKRFNEVLEATGTDAVPIETIKPLFSLTEWSILTPLLQKEGYELQSYDDTVRKVTRPADILDSLMGTPAVSRNKLIRVKEIMDEFVKNGDKNPSIQDVAGRAKESQIDDAEFEEIIGKLKRSGDVLELKQGYLTRIQDL